MNYGLTKVAVAIPALRVGDCNYNATQIVEQMRLAEEQKASVVCFPELCLTGYTCQDLFQQQLLLEETEAALSLVIAATKGRGTTVIIGLPVTYAHRLFNCAAVIADGRLLGVVPKTFLPNYHEFYEQRWFSSALSLTDDAEITLCGHTVPLSRKLLFAPNGSWTFGVEICEDLWAANPPSTDLCLQGAEIVFNLSASNALASKNDYRRKLVNSQSARCLAGYAYVGAGFGESTQDLVFTGHGFIAENGAMLAQAEEHTLAARLLVSEIDVDKLRAERRANTSFAQSQSMVKERETYRCVNYAVAEPTWECPSRTFNPLPFVPQGLLLEERCEEILYIQAAGLAKRLAHTNSSRVVLGISGGLDSTLALIVCVKAFDMLRLDRKGIIGVTMPGYGTTTRTYDNAVALMEALNITLREVNIRKACEQHFADIGHDGKTADITFENVQARERTQILMDLANLMNALVVGTGDLSELALGWATYNGDHMSMYGVNVSIPKTLIRHLVRWSALQSSDERVSATLLDIVDTPISPELIPADEHGEIAQRTEDLVGPYELHDFFLYYTLRFGATPEKIFFLARHAFDGHDERVRRYDAKTIKRWLTVFFRRFFSQQFKRSCLPDGPKVGSCAISPRGDWRMPSDAVSTLWLSACEKLPEA